MKIAVIGGGSSYTPELMKGLFEISNSIDLKEIYLHDIEESSKRLDIIKAFITKMKEASDLSLEIKTGFSFEEAIKDSSFIIFQFRPGMLRGRLRDETIPLKYNLIGQETTGVGGFTAALRAFPIVEKYISKVQKNSPDAYVINFTNPSGHITEFVRNYLNFDSFIGLCNVPVNLLNELSERFGGTPDSYTLKYYGLNHLSFTEKILKFNTDITENVLQEYTQEMTNIKGADFPSWLVESVKLLMNPYMRYYLMTDTMFKEIKDNEPRAKQVMKIEEKLFEIYEKTTSVKLPELLSQRGGSRYSQAAAYLIKTLVTKDDKTHIVNVPNNGSIKNLPDDYILEVPAKFQKDNFNSISQGRGNDFPLSWVDNIKHFERLAINTYLKKSKDLAIQSLLVHPLGPCAENVSSLLKEITEENKINFLE
ncbi:MAG: 6-phospho-beta-glucosidase [Kosmotogaceae bacterium]